MKHKLYTLELIGTYRIKLLKISYNEGYHCQAEIVRVSKCADKVITEFYDEPLNHNDP
jgi:hypothetical protein